MANRFGNEYRLPHWGNDAFPFYGPRGGKDTPTPDIRPYLDGKDPFDRGGDDQGPAGGSKVPRRPKSPLGGPGAMVKQEKYSV